MAKLSDLLGGLLRDVAESRAAADSLSKQYAEAYSQDPLLRHFPAPRLTIKDVTLRLRFAVSAQKAVGPAQPDKPYLEALWSERVAGAVLSSVLDRVAPANSALADKLRAQVAKFAAGRDLGATAAVDGKPSATVSKTVALLLRARNSLPKKTRDALPTQRAFSAAVTRSVQQALEQFVPAAQQVLAARAALRSELDILVAKSELENVPETQIQEVTVTFSSDDVLFNQQQPPSE